MLKKFLQKGQVLALYALILPLIFICLGMAADFGWWYFNLSRLQNAADAAVLVGANKIAADYQETHENFNPLVDFVNQVPEQYKKAKSTKIPNFNGDTETVTNLATEYADKNFEYPNLRATNFFKDYAYGDMETLNQMYYVVELNGKANHLFSIMEQFGDMKLKAVAVAQIFGNEAETPPPDPPQPPPIIDDLNSIKTSTVIVGNWEVQKWYYDNRNNNNWKNKYAAIYDMDELFNGKWNHFREPNKQIHATLKINNGKITLREENLVIQDHNSGASNVYETPANGSKKYNWYELESINLDFTQDMQLTLRNGLTYLTEDWDVYDVEDISGTPIRWRKPPTAEIAKIEASHGGSIEVRTHSQFNFEAPYYTRPEDSSKPPANYTTYQYDEDNPPRQYPDPLGVRIESEPMWYNLGVKNNQAELNTVRQIIININQSNMTELDADGNPVDANETYRPLIIFYDGPETNSKNPNLIKALSEGKITEIRALSKSRRSQPIILNLEDNFSGVLCVPNSPVVLNANGNKFRGLIFAQQYYSLKEDSDFYKADGRYYDSAEKTNEYFKVAYGKNSNHYMFVDKIGNVQYKLYSEGTNQNSSSSYYQNVHRYGDIDAFGIEKLEELFFTAGDHVTNIDVQEWLADHEGENLL